MDINKGLLPRQYKARTTLLGSIRRRNSSQQLSATFPSCSFNKQSTRQHRTALDIVTAALDECFRVEHRQQQQLRRRRQRRTVRFVDSSQNQIIQSSIDELTQEDIANGWWSVEESRVNKKATGESLSRFFRQIKQQQQQQQQQEEENESDCTNVIKSSVESCPPSKKKTSNRLLWRHSYVPTLSA